MILISVIIPVYNVEKYLNRCVESIVNQTYKNLEIILVDDGSPDRCPEMCDEWAAKDSRIKVIHKKNGGVSSARNAALKMATGDYIGFVDSDDSVYPDMYEFLLNNIVEYNADIARCTYTLDSDGVTKFIDYECNDEIVIYDSRLDMINDLSNSGHKCVVLWNKLYSKNVIKDIRFDETLNVGEDTVFNYMVFKNASRMVCNDQAKYYHYGNETNLTRRNDTNFNAYCAMKKLISDPDCPNSLYYKYFTFASMTLHDIVKNDFQYDFSVISKDVLAHRKKVSYAIKDNKRYKQKMFVLSVSKTLYKILLKLGF